jgi:hypothetical protein
VLIALNNIGYSQITNYVHNGGFELHSKPPGARAIHWSALDTGKYKYYGLLYGVYATPTQVPKNGFAYQWPRSGNNYFIFFVYGSSRGYPRNKLKGTLKPGVSYCISLYINLSDQSTHGISNFGFYFANNSIDTITQCTIPITYLTPQYENPQNNIITDTMNWVLLKGEFTASGEENNLILGNFNDNNNTTKLLVNPTNLPTHGTDYLIDDVSVIATDLPAYAGPDHALIPGDSAFIGREPDVGIDEACMWYQLPNDSVPIDTVAGLWVKPVGTATYVVRQQLNCGGVKWDTVVVYENPLWINSLFISAEGLKVYPNPADEILKAELRSLPDANLEDQVFDIMIYNNLGQLLKTEEITFKENSVVIKTDNLPEGVYSLKLKGSGGIISKRFMISR